MLSSGLMQSSLSDLIPPLLEGSRRQARADALADWLGTPVRLLTVDVPSLLESGFVSMGEARRLCGAVALVQACFAALPATALVDAEAVIRATGGLWRSAVEQLWVIPVDQALHSLGATCVATGGVASCAVTTAELLRPAVVQRAHGLFVLHNHPSGDATPSLADRRFTRACARACTAVGLVFHDHLVVAGGRWASCKSEHHGAWSCSFSGQSSRARSPDADCHQTLGPRRVATPT